MELNNFSFINSNNNFLIEKNQYRNKILTLNNLRDEYSKIQDKLNISTKLYNQQLKNYKTIKYYATFVIIALIIILILTILLSIFPFFSNDTKNALYIISLILLIVITYLYYVNFKYVNLYEKFTVSIGEKVGYAYLTNEQTTSLTNNQVIITTATCSSNNITFSPTISANVSNHANFYNLLLPNINEYSNSINDILNNMSLNIYTINNKTFSQDANIYIYNLYLEKKRQIEENKIKFTNLLNMLEIIKKQINYLFNIVFIIACFLIILLLGLVIYSTAPQLYIFVIILCVVLISILMIYFAFTIVQPTRMIANKNYWASVNPSRSSISKL